MNNKKAFLNINLWRQKGQSMVEYAVVATFGILCLTTGPVKDIIDDELIPAIQNNYRGYSYAISLSDYPDKEDVDDLRDMYEEQGMPDDQVTYLADGIEELVGDAAGYALDQFPELQEGLDLAEGLGLEFSDFCDFCDGTPW